MKKNSAMKAIITALIAAFIFSFQFSGPCSATPLEYRQGHEPVEMMADGVLARPLGLVSTIIGSTFFIVTLPFTIPSNSVESAKKQLIDYPAWFTFKRPLGEFGTRYEPPTISPMKKNVPAKDQDKRSDTALDSDGKTSN